MIHSALKSLSKITMATVILCVANGVLLASTTITFTPNPLVPTNDLFDFTDVAIKAQDKSDLNGPFLANAFALANITGYPNGSASIGTFPHFEVGVASGFGCTNMEYFDENSDASQNGSMPMVIPNPVLHFGFGLIGGLDFIGKIFSFNSSMYTVSYENDLATPEDYSFYSVGGRVRYNILPRFTIVPALFSFGGVTIAVGGDGMIGKAKVHGKYEAYFENIQITGAPAPLPDPYMINRVDFVGTYVADVNWKVISGTVTAIGYFELMTIFTFYTGFGITLGTGYFSVDIDGDGDCTTTDAAYNAAAGTDVVGTLTFDSSNKYKARPFIPAYILGAEVSLFFIKAHVETMVDLYTGKDVTALFGVRFEF